MFWIFTIAIVLFCGYYLLIRPQLYWKRRHVIQGPPIPILGDSFRSILGIESNADVVKSLYNRGKGNRYSGMYQFTLPTLILRDPELIKQIGVKYFNHFMDRRSFAPEGEIDELWNRNLFQLKGERWQQMRATLSPTFTVSKMRAMFVLMEKSAQQYVDFYMQKDEDCFAVDLKDSFTRFANDVIGNCAFGVTVDSLREPDNEFYMQGKDLTNVGGIVHIVQSITNLFFPSVTKFLQLPLLPPKSTAFFHELIKDSIRLREKQHIVRPDMINLMMEARRGRTGNEETGKTLQTTMTDVDIASQAMIFFFAGFDSISTCMSFCCYELALNPDIQEKLRREIDDIDEKHLGQLTYDALGNMTYMDMVVSESMRKMPPIPNIERICTKPFTIQAERLGETPLNVQPGDLLWLPIFGLHHDDAYFPNPDKFDPERFSPENKSRINPYAYIPFGVGPRSCIASRFALMEVKTLLFHVLSKFELKVIDKTVIPMKLEKWRLQPIIEGGCWVGFQRRQV